MSNSTSESLSTFQDTSRVEFDVNLSCGGCASKVKETLSVIPKVKVVSIDVEKQNVVVETSQPFQIIKEAIESTGKRAVLKGFGSSGDSNVESAVAELQSTSGIYGVIRFHQMASDLCVIDGTIDGLQVGEHGLHIHEYGDLSQGCESIGGHFNPIGQKHGGPKDQERHYGDLGNIVVNPDGRASFRINDHIVKVQDIIGRSIAVTADRDDGQSSTDDGNSGKSLACAIIARSAGLFKNPKRICACDGISIWDETKQPSASL